MESSNTNLVDYLISISKQGRQRSFIDLCEINLQNIFTVLYRLLNDNETAKKIAIQSFLHAWKMINEYEESTPFALWLKNIAIKKAIEEVRKDNQVKMIIEKRRNTENGFELMESLISSLPAENRIIFVLHDLEGYSYEDINELFGDMIPDEIRSKVINTREYLIQKLNL